MNHTRIDLSVAPSAMERLAASWGKAAPPPARRVDSNPPAMMVRPVGRSLWSSRPGQPVITRPAGCWLSRVLAEG